MAGSRCIWSVMVALALAVGVAACTRDPRHRSTGTHSPLRPSPVPSVSSVPGLSPSVAIPTRSAGHGHRSKASAAPRANGTGVLGIGDSIMVDAAVDLRAAITGLQINAEVGRQVEPGVSILRDLAATGAVPDTTIFGLGTNSVFLSSQLSELVHLTTGHRLIVVTTHCPYCAWTNANNAMVRSECVARRHCYVARFHGQARRHPEWFFSDGVHLPTVGAGARAYARIVLGALLAAT